MQQNKIIRQELFPSAARCAVCGCAVFVVDVDAARLSVWRVWPHPHSSSSSSSACSCCCCWHWWQCMSAGAVRRSPPVLGMCAVATLRLVRAGWSERAWRVHGGWSRRAGECRRRLHRLHRAQSRVERHRHRSLHFTLAHSLKHYVVRSCRSAERALTLLVGRQEGPVKT